MHWKLIYCYSPSSNKSPCLPPRKVSYVVAPMWKWKVAHERKWLQNVWWPWKSSRRGLPTSQTYGFISDDSPQWIVRWSSLPKFDLALSECGKNTTIFRGPVDLRFESNTSPLRHHNSEIFLTQWALGSRIRLQKRRNKYICTSGKAKGKEPFHSRFHLFPYTGGIGIFVETRGYDKSFFNDIYTVVSNTDVYLSVLRRVIGTASKQARLTWTWQHEVEGLWYMPLSQDCSLGLVPLTENNTP